MKTYDPRRFASGMLVALLLVLISLPMAGCGKKKIENPYEPFGNDRKFEADVRLQGDAVRMNDSDRFLYRLPSFRASYVVRKLKFKTRALAAAPGEVRPCL